MTISPERTRARQVTAHGDTQAVAVLAWHNGQFSDACPQLALALPVRRRAHRPADRLHIICEPVAWSAQSEALIPAVIGLIQDTFARVDADDPIAAIAAALEAANDAVFQQNLASAPAERVAFGVTCLVIRDADLIIAQTPPTQLIIAQNGTPVALPDLDSWREHEQTELDEAAGLGLEPILTPALYRAALEPDDLITLCSANLAMLLASVGVGPLLGDDLLAARDYLITLIEQHYLPTASAAIFTPEFGSTAVAGSIALMEPTTPVAAAREDDDARYAPAMLHEESWFERSLREMRARTQVIAWPRHDNRRRATILPFRQTGEDQEQEPPYGTPSLPDALEQESAPAETAWADTAHEYADADEDDTYDEYDEDEGWDDDATGESAGYYHAPARPRRTLLQALFNPIAVAILGFGTALEHILPARQQHKRARYLEHSRDRVWPIGVLDRFERRRFQLSRLLPILVIAALVALAYLGVVGVRNQLRQAEAARFDQALARIAQAREAAVTATDRQAAHDQLLALPTNLAAIPNADKPGRPEQIAGERQAIAAALDRVDGVQRLPANARQVLAPLPATPAQGGPRPQLVVGNGQQFVLLNGVVYTVDGQARALKKILAKGDVADGVGVGQLLGIVWRIDSLFAFDDTHGYVRRGDGAWIAQPIAASGQKLTAVNSFDGNLYFLQAERGQIVKYRSGAYAQAPQPWSSTKINGDLGLALDMVTDQDIYVLLSDGRLLDLYQGDVKATYIPAVTPPLAGATAIAAAPGGSLLYVLDAREGRIVRLGRDGSGVVNYKAASSAQPFTNARDLAVDEQAGIVYLLTDDGVVSVQLPR
ncbi:MAG: hypothetical protein ACTHMU_02815 [Thermomicrobiales bacterium]